MYPSGSISRCERTNHLDLESLGMSVENLRKIRAINGNIRIVGLSPYGFRMMRAGMSRRREMNQILSSEDYI